jgi:hypothetical protein
VTLRLSDFFIPLRMGFPQEFYDPAGQLITSIQFLDFSSAAEPSRFTLRQTDPRGEWNCDWLLRVEADGDITEYGDLYPKGSGILDRADFWRPYAQVYFRQGYELRWSPSGRGQAKPDFTRSSLSKWGNGTYICQVGKIADEYIELYNEQSFGKRTDRLLMHLVRGVGPTRLTYYDAVGNSEAISVKGDFP